MKVRHSSQRARGERRSADAELRHRGGFFRRLLYLLALAGIVVALLPVLVAKTPLRNMIAAYVLPGDAVRISIGGASLGWFTAPSLSGIEVRDAGGQPLFAIESVRIGRTPWSLASNWRDLGEIEIWRPMFYVAIRAEGTNLEDTIGKLLAKWMPETPGGLAGPAAAAPETMPPAVAVAVRVVEGTILAEETATGRRWRASGLNLQYDTRDALGTVDQLAASGQIEAIAVGGDGAAAATPAGRFAASLVTGADGRQQLQWQAEALVLDVLQPWLRRFATGAELGGTLSGQGSAAWTVGTPPMAQPRATGSTALGPIVPADFATAGTLRIEQLDASVPALLGDRVRLARVELPWQITMQPAGLALEQLELRTDVGRLAAHGTIDAAVFDSETGFRPEAVGEADRHNVEVRGELDLARMAVMLPNALRIRDDTTITAGRIELTGRAQPLDGAQSLTGTVRAAGLTATSAGRPLRWDQPVSVAFDVRREHGNLRLQTLRCESEFLTIDAAGTPQQLTANAEFDLNRLATQLSQFVDLSSVELAGTGTAHLNWHQAAADQFAASANSDLAQLRVALGEGAIWAEPRLAIKAEAAGMLDPATRRPTHVTTARVQLDAEGDVLDAQLTSPVDWTATPTATWPVSLRVSGSIARWLTRARPWFTPDPMQVDGQSEATADVRVATTTPPAPAAATAVDVRNAKLTVSNLRVTGVGWNIQEPRVELAGDLSWDGITGKFAASTAQLVSSTVAMAAREVRLRTGGDGPPQVNGSAAFRADLARVAAWQAVPGQPAAYQPQGSLTGNVRFDQQGDRITGELTATGEQLSLAQLSTVTGASRGVAAPGRGGGPPGAPESAYQTIWREPQVNLRGTTVYESTADRLAFRQVQIQSNTLQASAEGQIDRLTTTADVNVAGTMNYDLAQITPLMRPYVGPGVQLVGRETAQFTMAGQLFAKTPAAGHWSRSLQARLEAPWSSANLYGLPVGGGKLAAALGDGAIRVDPLALAVAEGQLTAAPHVRLDPEPMELLLPRGPLITGVRISPEVSEAMLKYIAPVLAGATQSEGKFSLELDGARVPLTDARQADVAGQMTVHSVRVVPGPMAREWIGLAQQVEALAKRRDPAALAQRQPATLLAIQDQQVNFRVVGGRVYHQGMQFQVGDVTMRSEGSVGLDETLSLVLHVPIQDKWIEGQNLLVGLRGQSLSIPVSGTLTRPRMDQSAVAGLSQQLLQGAAQQAIGGELNKALDKFLKPR